MVVPSNKISDENGLSSTISKTMQSSWINYCAQWIGMDLQNVEWEKQRNCYWDNYPCKTVKLYKGIAPRWKSCKTDTLIEQSLL